MKAGKYTVRELFVNSYIEQIVIPEIQRDYVWGEEQVKGILDSINEDFEAFCNATIYISTDDDDIKKLFEDFYKKQKYSSNIGFIYAYNDPEYAGKYFLIDGQQRITTIYLLLLALCIKIDKSIFDKYYYTNNILKLDYRVRESAHLFLKKFVNYFLSAENPSMDKVEKQHWFFDANELDPTINSIIANYKTVLSYLDKNDLNQASFLDYIQHYIEFWYFDTNLSDQGEELYIYMNARGEQIQPNENLKADLISTLKTQEEKNDWGIKWENWQDFFWQKRGENENADTGFNEFINCIAGLEFYKRKLEDKNYNNRILNDLLTLPLIEGYIKTLQFLECERKSFTNKYSYAGWVDKYYILIWSYLNKSNRRKTNWFADFRDKNRNDDRNNMVLMWSLFSSFNSNRSDINSDEFFRVARFFYIRYNNNNRSVSTLQNTIELIEINKIIDKIELQLDNQEDYPEEGTDTKYRTEEEKSKYQFLAQFLDRPVLLRRYESVIWEIEDHKYNLDGSYLGNTNISHLIDLATNPPLELLNKIKGRFELLMNGNEGYEKETLITLLFHYGVFWNRETPWYYYNFKFDDWRRIIRNVDGDQKAFKEFFNQFLLLKEPTPLSVLIEIKNKDFLKSNFENIFSINDFGKQLIAYSLLLDNIWSAGFHMCYEGEEEKRLFEKEYVIFNTNRYKGSHLYLWEEAKIKFNSNDEILKHLNKLKN